MMQFSATHERDGVHLTLVGQWQDIAAYYRGDDGNAWIYNHCTRGWSNGGDYAEFVRTFTGRRRGQLGNTNPNASVTPAYPNGRWS